MNYLIYVEMDRPGRHYDEWCTKNCNNNWKLLYEGSLGHMLGKFENESDAMAFKLRWT